ncbi:MAG: hypothetical protein JO239_14705, partial [Paraburkholderia sp.]|nr:hypothetical protein [Paraburkholderia sp.]
LFTTPVIYLFFDRLAERYGRKRRRDEAGGTGGDADGGPGPSAPPAPEGTP